MAELKPCPFCGGKAEKRTFINSAGIYVYRVYCPQCQIGTMKHTSIKRACETWNTRYLIEYNVEMKDRWIPCSERLPELDTMVIVCYYGSDCIFPMQGETVTEAVARQNKVPTVTMGFLDEEGWNGADMFPMMVQPTFWMNLPDAPLPEPPEKE